MKASVIHGDSTGSAGWAGVLHSTFWPRRAGRMTDDVVVGEAGAWLRRLPTGVRPVHLQRHFARIANDVFRLWDDPVALEGYFKGTEVDARGNRRGFPPIVREELLALHAYSVRCRALWPETSAPH